MHAIESLTTSSTDTHRMRCDCCRCRSRRPPPSISYNRCRVRWCSSNQRRSRRSPAIVDPLRLPPVLLLLALIILSPQHALGFLLRAAASSFSWSNSAMVRRVPITAAATVEAGATAAAGAVHMTEGIRELAALYDVLLIDQWGVMHDGHDPYPGAVECMQELQRTGKHIILLSNSSKRKAGSLTRLKAMGFDPDAYVDVLTSGELVFEGMQHRAAKPYSEIEGSRVLVFGSGDDDRDYVGSLGCTLSSVETADFLLARGPFTILDDSEDAAVQRFGPGRILHESPEFAALADRAIARGLPLLVSNPDVVRPGYDRDPMPGMLGQAYERKGGRVIYVGKPHALVYERCRELMARVAGSPEAAGRLRVCAVGDSMWNDVKGAANEGFGSVFIADGIHAEALGVAEAAGEAVDPTALQAFLKGFDYAPTHVLPRFRW